MDTDEEFSDEEEEFDENEGTSQRSAPSEDEQEKQNDGTSKRSAASEEEEEEEKQETSEDENEGTSKRSAASEDEQEKSMSCSRQETHGKKRKLMLKLTLSDAQECKDDHTLSWVRTALANISSVSAHMLGRNGFIAHPSPKTCLPDLERVRGAAMALVNNTDSAISFAKAQQNLIDRKALEGKLLALQQELAQSKEQSQAERHKQDLQAKAELLKQSNLFQKEKESLTCSHKLEREALIDQYTQEQRDLKRQLEEEKDKSICCVCHDKPRDTIILPCLHFQYCFSCLLRHREANSNTCPTCRGPIQGLSMSSYLATQ